MGHQVEWLRNTCKVKPQLLGKSKKKIIISDLFYVTFFNALSFFYFLFIIDKKATAKIRSLVNFEDLNKILKSEIFLYKDSQLRVAHVTLRYEPISTRF